MSNPPISLYGSSYPVAKAALETLAALLNKGQETSGADDLPDARLYENMSPLTTQVQYVCNIIRNLVSRTTGQDLAAAWAEDETLSTFEDMHARIAATRAFVEAADEEVVNAKANETFTMVTNTYGTVHVKVFNLGSGCQSPNRFLDFRASTAIAHSSAVFYSATMHYSRLLFLATAVSATGSHSSTKSGGYNAMVGANHTYVPDLETELSHLASDLMTKGPGKFNKTRGNEESRSRLKPGTAVLTPRYFYNNIRFVCDVEIGNPPQKFALDVDIGASTTWVTGGKTVTGERMQEKRVKGKHHYKAPKSKTSQKLEGSSFREVYPDGTGVKGSVYRDFFHIGGEDGIGPFPQFFGSAKVINPRFAKDNGFQGILGLGNFAGSGMRPNKLKGVIDTLIDRLSYDFALTLKPNGGYLDWGFHNTSRYTGDLFWTSFWTGAGPHVAFTASGYAIGNGTMNFQDIDAGPDTLTSFIHISEVIADAYYDTFPPGVEKTQLPGGNTGYTYPCDFTPPDFILQLIRREWFTGREEARKNFTVPGVDLRFQEVREGVCLGAIMAQPPSFPQIAVLGWPFLKNKSMFFDGPSKIGFATAA